MKRFLLFLGGLFLFGCTPTVKEVAIYRGKKDVIIVKRGKFLFSEEERSFIKKEATRLGIEIPNRKEIENHLRNLLKNRKSLEIALKRANLYIPYIKPVLKEYGLPEELALLPLVESGFNPFAVSRSGAGGIWQLMPFTARRYGLKVGSYLDERFDLVKSTRAAAGYLKDLYRMFGNWELVLAAYNCGEGCVSRRTKGIDFWRSKWALPEQTRKYVPMFFAALLIARSPEKYGLSVRLDSLSIERKLVQRGERVNDFVRRAGIGESTFRDLNPHIRGDRIPGGTYVYVPKGAYRTITTRFAKAEIPRVKKRAVKLKEAPEKQEVKTLKVVRSAPKLRKNVKKKKVKVAKLETPKRPVPEKPVKKVSDNKPPVVKGTEKVFSVRKPAGKSESGRVVIKSMGETVVSTTKVITLENGAVLYIKE